MADNFQVTQGSGTVIAADQVGDGSYYQKIKLFDPVTDGTQGIGIAANPLRVDPTGTTTQPISVSSLPLPTGASTAANQTTELASLASIDTKTPVQGQKAMAASTPVVMASDQSPISIAQIPCTLSISTTAATGVGVTATLPAVASQFHYISFIEIKKYFTAANAASATPLVVTTTNLSGSLAFTFGQPLGTIGSTDRDMHNPNAPIKSSVVNTATTIVCPATVGIIWRVNVYYYTAA